VEESTQTMADSTVSDDLKRIALEVVREAHGCRCQHGPRHLRGERAPSLGFGLNSVADRISVDQPAVAEVPGVELSVRSQPANLAFTHTKLPCRFRNADPLHRVSHLQVSRNTSFDGPIVRQHLRGVN
jgi:hypothetical protein